jgi:hypothetical protein
MIRLRREILISFAAVLLLCGVALAQERPEHPTANPPAKSSHTYTMDELEKAIKQQIVATQDANGGKYPMKDDKEDKTWSMVLDHVHRERLSRLDAKTYFACTDFKSDDGHTVDVDFFMKDDGEKLAMTDATIHKVDGKARYGWKEKDGYWVRVPADK